jgi:hypothetical protein
MSTHDEQAYDGELAMLRGFVDVIRVAAEHGDMSQVRQLIVEHDIDAAEALAEAEGKSSRPTADATPDKVDRFEARLAQLLDTIRTHGGKWSTGALQELRRKQGGTKQRGTARRDLAELYRRGHLHQHGGGDGRFYTLKRRGGDAR